MRPPTSGPPENVARNPAASATASVAAPRVRIRCPTGWSPARITISAMTTPAATGSVRHASP